MQAQRAILARPLAATLDAYSYLQSYSSESQLLANHTIVHVSAAFSCRSPHAWPHLRGASCPHLFWCVPRLSDSDGSANATHSASNAAPGIIPRASSTLGAIPRRVYVAYVAEIASASSLLVRDSRLVYLSAHSNVILKNFALGFNPSRRHRASSLASVRCR